MGRRAAAHFGLQLGRRALAGWLMGAIARIQERDAAQERLVQLKVESVKVLWWLGPGLGWQGCIMLVQRGGEELIFYNPWLKFKTTRP